MARRPRKEYKKYPSLKAQELPNGKWECICSAPGCNTKRIGGNQGKAISMTYSHMVAKHDADPFGPVG